MKIGPGLDRNSPGVPVWLTLLIFCLGMALAGLTGCGKSCDKLDAELEAYIQGGAPSADKDKLLKQCEDAITKCPSLSSPYEVMGDLKAKENQPKEAIANYQKALGLSAAKERIQGKIDKNEALADEQERKEAVKAANETEEAAKEAARKVGGAKMSEYPNLDESIRLAWCEEAINKKKESLEKRRSRSKSGKPFILHADAKYLDTKLIATSKVIPDAQVYDITIDILEKRTDQSVD
ncbi:MAG TPA: hypothetical protein PLR60_11295 [Syntrophorhabdaceae bacterium]|nr:hypothetical protein [Syntrophorhabdaceae bacterium]